MPERLLALGILMGVVVAISQLGPLGDRGIREGKAIRREPESYRSAVRRVLSADVPVVDLSTNVEGLRVSLPLATWKLIGSPVISAGLLWAQFSMPAAAAAGIGSALFLAITAPSDVMYQGFMSRDGSRPRRDIAFYWLALVVKWLHVGLALWMLLTAADALIERRIAVIPWIVAGLLLAGTAHILPTLMVQFVILRHRSDDSLMFDDESVLLLRSFGDDKLKLWTPTGLGGITGRLLPSAKLRFEVLLTQMSAGTAMVAIGRPGEPLKPVGAVRTYWEDEEWQKTIQRSANRLRKVIVVAGTSSGLAWELSCIREWGLLTKTIFVLPPGDRAQTASRLTRLAEALGVDVLPEDVLDRSMLVALSVDAAGQVTYHMAPGRDWAAYGVLIAHSITPERTRTTASTTDLSSPPTKRPGTVTVRRKASVSPYLVEPVPHLKMASILNAVAKLGRHRDSQGRVTDSSARGLRRAVQALGDDPALAGTRAYYGAIAVLLELSTITSDELDPGQEATARRCQQEFSALLDLARQARRRVTISAGLTMTPDEIEVSVLDDLAIAHEALGETDQRVRALREAVAVSTRIPDAVHEVTARRNHASGLRALGRPDLALDELRLSLSIAQNLSQAQITSAIHQEIAVIEAVASDFSSAADAQAEAVALLRNMAEPQDLHDAELLGVEYQWCAGRHDEALSLLQEVLKSDDPEDPGLAHAASAQVIRILKDARADGNTQIEQAVTALVTATGWNPAEQQFDSQVRNLVKAVLQSDDHPSLAWLRATLAAVPELKDDLEEFLGDEGFLSADFWLPAHQLNGEPLGLVELTSLSDLLRQRAGHRVVTCWHTLAVSLLAADHHQRCLFKEPKIPAALLRSMADDLIYMES